MAIKATYSDFDMSLEPQADGDLKRQTDVDAVINSISNIVSTMQGSRRMVPEFAAPFQAILFEPMDEDTAYRLGSMLLEAIERWDDRVIVEDININADYEKAQYDLTLNFRIRASDEVEAVKYILKQG